LSANAKHSQVLLFRRGGDEQVSVQEIDLKKVLQGKNLSSDLKILPGDMVFVPKSRISKLKDFANMTYLRLPIPY
jgi:polysaccharide export outer membrane protein